MMKRSRDYQEEVRVRGTSLSITKSTTVCGPNRDGSSLDSLVGAIDTFSQGLLLIGDFQASTGL